MSIYDDFAKDCVTIAEKTEDKSTKTKLLRLADQWRIVAYEASGEAGKSTALPVSALQAVERR
jgi:hypothetical protein